MRSVACSLAIVLAFVGCAQVYTATSKNPALVRLPISRAFGVGNQINLVAIDGVSVDAALRNGEYWRIDPGLRRFTIAYEASNKIVGARVAAGAQCKIGGGREVSSGLRKLACRCESISPSGIESANRFQRCRIIFNAGTSNLSESASTVPNSGNALALITAESRSASSPASRGKVLRFLRRSVRCSPRSNRASDETRRSTPRRL